MNGLFYPKLAAGNIKKNYKTYLPYILTCIFTVSMYYIMKSLTENEGLSGVFGGGTVGITLGLGCWVIAIFAAIFLFYTNSFLMKNRKKEFGLFNILGMEKRHIAKVIFFESVYVFLISMVFGLGFGIILDKLMYLLLSKLIGAEINLGFYVSQPAIISSAVLFGLIFILIFLNSIRLIGLSKPIDLLHGDSAGEKEPKAKWFIAILGLLSLGGGYYIAVTVKNPLTAITFFFIAVILVIIGTYLLFTAGSIAILKLLKRNKVYYYKTKHFISVSGMIYRMKQNAVGLANICILSTMVLVMVSSTASLMLGINDTIMERYPYQISFKGYNFTDEDLARLSDIVRKTAEEDGTVIKREYSGVSLDFTGIYQENDEFAVTHSGDISLANDLCYLSFMTADCYNSITGENVTFADNQVLMWSESLDYSLDYFNLFGKRYDIVAKADKAVIDDVLSVSIYPTVGVIVKDRSVIDELYLCQKKVYGEAASDIVSRYMADIEGDDEAQIAFYNKVCRNIGILTDDNDLYISTASRALAKDSVMELYGSLFFLGIFLGLLFTMATVLIIYYKQISEGFDDKKRFEIMQNVGLDEREIKKSIHSQILTVFFLPLMMAGLHMAFAFPIIKKLLLSFALNNTLLFAMTTLGTFLVFTLIYAAIYSFTAKTYYSIVRVRR